MNNYHGNDDENHPTTTAKTNTDAMATATTSNTDSITNSQTNTDAMATATITNTGSIDKSSSSLPPPPQPPTLNKLPSAPPAPPQLPKPQPPTYYCPAATTAISPASEQRPLAFVCLFASPLAHPLSHLLRCHHHCHHFTAPQPHFTATTKLPLRPQPRHTIPQPNFPTTASKQPLRSIRFKTTASTNATITIISRKLLQPHHLPSLPLPLPTNCATCGYSPTNQVD